MAIESVRLRKNLRDGSLKADTRQYRSVYLVQTDNPETGHYAVATAAGIPTIGSAHPEDSAAKVTGIDPEVDNDDGMKWKVTVTWEKPSGDTEENPLDAEPEISYGFATFSRVADQDVYGNPIVSSAGEKFDPPLEQDDSRQVVLIKRNEATYSAANSRAYQDAVNADAVLGAEIGQLKMGRITADRRVHSVFGVYYEVTYEIHFREDGWDRKVLDQGTWELAEPREETIEDITAYGDMGVEVSTRKVIVDGSTKMPFQQPTLLNGKGQKLEDGADPHFLHYRTYRWVNFSPLDLPEI